MTTNLTPTLITFFTLIEQEDGEALEAARDLVRLEHFPALVDYYWKQTNWYRKAGVIDLLQDTIVPISQPVMRDFLRAPADTRGDWLDINKVVAVIDCLMFIISPSWNALIIHSCDATCFY